MKLDKRILPGKRPLSCLETEEAKQFIGKEGYFTDVLAAFTNMSRNKTSVLTAIDEKAQSCFKNNSGRIKWDFFLPAEWVKPEKPENKWRPFTLDEFIDRFDLEVGTRVFLIRYKTHPEHQKRLLLTGLIHDKDPALCGVCLGGFYFTFSNLFDMFEVRFGKKDWQPFGVEE